MPALLLEDCLQPVTAPSRAQAFLDEACPPTPCLAIDLSVVAVRYAELTAALPGVGAYYAVKACPEPKVVRALGRLGSCFDVASPGEIDLCLAEGVSPSRLSYGNPVKKHRDIAKAFEQGVRQFVVDSAPEVAKLAAAAPGASVLVRLAADGTGSSWPLDGKFGCPPAVAFELVTAAADLGLDPAGLAFHVGSDQRDPSRWSPAIATAAEVFERAAAAGIGLRKLDVGGGFPGHYVDPVAPIASYGAAIEEAIERYFGGARPELLCEPGRHLVADAGVLRSEVVLVAMRGGRRWVYLDAGRFGGLAETEGEAICYQLATRRPGPSGSVVLAGPTCDSVDVLYKRSRCELPLALDAGDIVDILGAGAYTASYASVGFNGFDPPVVYCME